MQVNSLPQAAYAAMPCAQTAATQSSLFVRIASAAGAAIISALSVAESLSAFGAGAAVGVLVTNRKAEDALKLAGISFIAFSALNVLRLIFTGPGSFIYSAFTHSTLGVVGLSVGLIGGGLNAISNRHNMRH